MTSAVANTPNLLGVYFAQKADAKTNPSELPFSRIRDELEKAQQDNSDVFERKDGVKNEAKNLKGWGFWFEAVRVYINAKFPKILAGLYNNLAAPLLEFGGKVIDNVKSTFKGGMDTVLDGVGGMIDEKMKQAAEQIAGENKLDLGDTTPSSQEIETETKSSTEQVKEDRKAAKG